MVENILLINSKTGKSLELDKVSTPNYILESVDWGQVSSTHFTYKFVNQIGDFLDNVNLGTREISIVGWIVAENEAEMDMRKRFLNMLVNPMQNLECYYKKFVIRFTPDTSIKYGTVTKENNEVIVKFKIEGVCHNPLFENEQPIVKDAITTRGYFHFPLIINTTDQDPPQIIFGIREPSLFINILNEGQVNIGFKVIFTARGNDIINPKIMNISTFEYIKINKTLQAGEKVEINTIVGEKSIIGTFQGVETSYYKYRDINSSWLQLEVGDNVFTYDADSGKESLDISIIYNNKYLEVQECY